MVIKILAMVSMQHCCQLMTDLINDPRVCIGYSSRVREYYINLKRQYAVHGIFYCPWCGTKLPESLREQYLDTLKNEYNIDSYRDADDAEDAGTLPEEFKTDEWWKKRGY